MRIHAMTIVSVLALAACGGATEAGNNAAAEPVENLALENVTAAEPTDANAAAVAPPADAAAPAGEPPAAAERPAPKAAPAAPAPRPKTQPEPEPDPHAGHDMANMANMQH